MKSTFSVIFYLKRQAVKKDGTVPVMGRITVDGTQTQFSSKLSVDPKLWDTKGGRVTGRSSAALETNRLLDKMRVSINRHYQEIMERDNFVTAEKVKNAFLGLEHRCHTLMQVFRQHNEDYAKQVEAGMKAKATLSKYLVVYKHLQEFLNIRYHVKDIALKELTPAFISDFEMFLRTDKHCCTNTVWLYVCPLRTMVFIAINNEWLARDPFREYEIKKEETTRGFLTKEEIRMLMDGKLKNAKQELYRDLYLFCAFTGLSFSDMRNLREENIRTYFDNHEWININRQKTGVESNIRLLDLPRRIIEKYRGLCEDGRIFPVPHYMTCLYGIRAVAKRCGITYGSLTPYEDSLVIIDDSIVRGTTLKQSIIGILDRLHPKKIVIVSSSPQVRYPDYYGIDMASMEQFIAFKAAIALLEDRGMQHVIEYAYRKSKAQTELPKEKMANYVKEIYAPFTDEEISAKIVELLTPAGTQAKVQIVYQTLEGLHEACPNHPGDWYFSGDYPTPGGVKLVNKAFIDWVEQNYQF
jgi:integrase